jgi:uncharacterized protein (DUF924 family)
MAGSRALSKASPTDILDFWLAAGPDRWFEKDDELDAEIRARFQSTYEAAAEGLLSTWEDWPGGALALIIVLDQFPRNIFRGSARCYMADPLSREIARRAIARGVDQKIALPARIFFYLPFEHSETLADQERSVALFLSTGDAELIRWAELHADIIRRFGRFPHRNAALGRATTPEEQAFLDSGEFQS